MQVNARLGWALKFKHGLILERLYRLKKQGPLEDSRHANAKDGRSAIVVRRVADGGAICRRPTLCQWLSRSYSGIDMHQCWFLSYQKIESIMRRPNELRSRRPQHGSQCDASQT